MIIPLRREARSGRSVVRVFFGQVPGARDQRAQADLSGLVQPIVRIADNPLEAWCRHLER